MLFHLLLLMQWTIYAENRNDFEHSNSLAHSHRYLSLNEEFAST